MSDLTDFQKASYNIDGKLHLLTLLEQVPDGCHGRADQYGVDRQ